MRSIRKVLVEALVDSCNVASDLTGKSINDLPEFFLAVNIAKFVKNHFSTFTFSMEDKLIDVCKEIGIDYQHADPEYRISELSRADLVIKSVKTKKIMHIVEFKKNLSSNQIRKDVLRLAWLCVSAPRGHRLEKNFLVVVTHRDLELVKKRTAEIKNLVSEISPNIKVNFEPVELNIFKSTHRNGLGRNLCGGVWEIFYEES